MFLPPGGRLLLFPQRERLGVELRVATHADLLPGALAAGLRGDRGDADPRESAAVDAGGADVLRGASTALQGRGGEANGRG